jgi:hypothetical protein
METSCGDLTATQPWRRRKTTLGHWGDGFLLRRRDETSGLDNYSLDSQSEGIRGTHEQVEIQVNRVRHTKREDQEEEQGPNRDVMQHPVSQVEYTNITIWPPVGDTLFPNLSPKFGQGHWGSPLCNRALGR